MALFNPDNHTKSPKHKQLYSRYEIINTLIGFLAGLLFLIGSIFFFYPNRENLAIWMFVIGSALFMVAPTVRLIQELHYVYISKQQGKGNMCDDV